MTASEQLLAPPAIGEQSTPTHDLRERLLRELPVQQIGNADPLNPVEASYPNVLYHGTEQDFDLDDSLTHRTTPNRTGQHTGRGFYCAAEPVAASFGTGTIVEVLPKEAKMLDLTSPMADQPFSEDFRSAFVRYQKERLGNDGDTISQAAVAFAGAPEREGRLITSSEAETYTEQLIGRLEAANGAALPVQDKQKIRATTTASLGRWNTVGIMQDPETSLHTLFATHNEKNGPSKYRDAQVVFDISGSLDFLVDELGIDGAQTIQTFGPEAEAAGAAGEAREESDWDDDPMPNTPEQQSKDAAVRALDPSMLHGYVFWKLDKVGNRALWERRAKDAPPVGGMTIQVASVGPETIS